MMMDQTLNERLALRLRVDDFYADYAHVLDDDRLEEWPDFFTQDGIYRIVTRENRELGLPLHLIYCDGQGMMIDRIAAMRTANIYEPHVYCHSISAVRVLGAEGGEVRARSNFTVLRTMTDGQTAIFACGRTFDTLLDVDGELRLRERLVVLDSKRIDTLLVIPL
jgi:anthranilate 1,2-dioxygenase small subunit